LVKINKRDFWNKKEKKQEVCRTMRGLPFAVQWIHETRIPLLEIAEMKKLAVCTSLIRSTGAVKPPD
jgi:hypothetical protein